MADKKTKGVVSNFIVFIVLFLAIIVIATLLYTKAQDNTLNTVNSIDTIVDKANTMIGK